MPGARELQRGIRLGVYRDPEKAAREERQVQVAEQRANLADTREARAGANDDTRTQLDKLRFENAVESARNTENAEKLILEDALAARKKLAAVSAASADLPEVLRKIDLEHPRALMDKSYQEQVKYNDGIYQKWNATKQADDRLQEQRRYDEAKKAGEKQALADARNQSIEGLSKMGGKLKSATVTATGEIAPVVDFTDNQTPQMAAQKLAQARYEKALTLRMSSSTLDTDQKAYLDKEIRESSAALSPQPAVGAAIASQSDYDALPSGSEFNFNGKRGRKP